MSGSQKKAAPQNNGGSPVKIEMRRVDEDDAGIRLDRWV